MNKPPHRAMIALSGLPAVCACVHFVSGYMCLARSPQNPDGAELVMGALQGAVLHPPGYPVQAWIGKLWLLVPFANPSWGYALLCLVLQSIAVWAFILVVREYGLRPLAGAVAAIVLFCFPPVFMLGIQPEKYALVILFACLMLMDRFWYLAGIAFTQHFGLAILFPVVIWRYSRREGRRRWFRFTVVTVAGFMLAQLSLLLLARFGGWPDWGALASLHDVVRHTLRSDIGFLGGTKGMIPLGEQLSALSLLVFQWGWLALAWMVALIPAGLRLKEDRTAAVLMASILLGIGALYLARLPGSTLLDKEYLSRYWVVIMPVLALTIGYGLEHASRWWKIAGLTALVATLLALFVHRQEISLARSNIFSVYRESLSSSMGRELGSTASDAFYVSSSDVESFWGVRSSGGGLRFPIAGDYPWFLQRKAAELDPRIRFWCGGQPPASTAAIMKRVLALGIPVVTTTPEVLPVAAHWKNFGLYSKSSASDGPAAGDDLDYVAGAVCDALVMYGQDNPAPGRYGSLELWEKLREPFSLLAAERRREGRFKEAEAAEVVHASMKVGKHSSALAACLTFLKSKEQHVQGD